MDDFWSTLKYRVYLRTKDKIEFSFYFECDIKSFFLNRIKIRQEEFEKIADDVAFKLFLDIIIGYHVENSRLSNYKDKRNC